MTRHIGALADRLLATVAPKATARAACNPGCNEVPMCCLYSGTNKYRWRTCSTQCVCRWGGWC